MTEINNNNKFADHNEEVSSNIENIINALIDYKKCDKLILQDDKIHIYYKNTTITLIKNVGVNISVPDGYDSKTNLRIKDDKIYDKLYQKCNDIYNDLTIRGINTIIGTFKSIFKREISLETVLND